jgi:hypothetical protein
LAPVGRFEELKRLVCYVSYDKVDGRLTATISSDESITGTIEDTFKAVPSGAVFIVRTTFATCPPS